MKIAKLACSIIAISFGAFMFAYGEVDDSPGGQLLGAVVVFIGILGVIKSRKKNSN